MEAGSNQNLRSLSVSWSDPVALAESGRAMPGIEFLRAIRHGRLPAPPIARLLGFELVEVEPGLAVFELTPGEQHYNPIGVVHGGVAMTLLDSAMGCAVQTEMPAGGGYTTLEAKTNLVRPISSATGRLRRSESSCTSASASRRRKEGSRTSSASSTRTLPRHA
jgi:uncharacterized protein (TIGR00369 family)